MDYYYALLNSYSLLKKRKFKLSIQEQEGPDETAAKGEAEKYMKAAEGNPFGSAVAVKGGSGKVGKVWEKEAREGAGTQGGQPRPGGIMFSPTENSFPSFPIETVGDEGFNRLVGFIRGEEEKGTKDKDTEDGDEQDGQETGPTGMDSLVPQDPIGMAIEKVGTSLDALGELPDFIKPLEDPEVEPPDAWEILREQVEKSTQPIGNAPPLLTDEQAQAVLVGGGALLDMTEKVLEDKEEAARGKFTHDINSMIEEHKIAINEDGIVTFDGVAFSTVFTQANPINEGFKAALEAIQEAQDLNVRELGIGSEAIGIEKDDEDDEDDKEGELPSEATIKGSDSSVRGITAEAMDTCAPKMNAWVTAGRGKAIGKDEREEARDALIECVSMNMQNKGIDVDTVLKVLGIGMNDELGKILVNKEALKDSHTYQFIKEGLVRDLGLSPKEAHTLLMDIIEGGNGAKAIFVALLANRQFTTNLFGEGEGNMVPTTTRGAGQDIGAQDPGNKADVVDVFCKDDPRFKNKKAIEDHYGKLAGGEEPTDGNCFAGAAGVEDLVQEEEDCEECAGGGCFSVPREMKVHDKSNKSSTLGETSIDNIGRACGDEGGRLGEKDKYALSPEGQTFIKDQKERLENCGVKTGPACKGLAAIQKRISKVTSVLEKGGAAVAGVPAMHAAEAQIDSAATLANEAADERVSSNQEKLAACKTKASCKTAQKGVDKAIKDRNALKKKWDARKKSALRCMSAKKGEGSKPDCEELKKTKDYVAENMMAAEFDKHTKPNGTMTKEGEDMMLTIYAISAGSQTETFNDKRMLQGSAQKVSYRNRNIRDNISAVRSGKGKIVRKKGAKTTRIEVDGELQASLTIEKGTTKVKAPHTVGTLISGASDEEPAKKSPKADVTGEESMFMEFLKGQQTLLESLFKQTISNPNT